MFQDILVGLKGLGGSFAKGIGSSYGLPFELTKTAGKMTGAGKDLPTDIYSPFYEPGKSPGIWDKIGFMLGEKAGSSKAPTLPSGDFPSVNFSTQVSQSAGYKGGKKKSQLETMLEQLARR